MSDVDPGQTWPAPSFLGRLSSPARHEVLGLGSPTAFAPGATMLRQGDHGGHVILIVAGFAKVAADTANGQRSMLAVRLAGDLLGELGVISGAPRSASVVACGPVRAVTVAGPRFLGFLERRAEAGIAISAMIGDRLRRANLWRQDFQSYSARARTARVLIEVTGSFPHHSGVGWALPLTQPELASLAGIKLRTLESEMASLERSGAIRRRYKAVQVIDMDRLYEAAEVPVLPH